MAIHWQVKFRSLRANTLYTVNIYDSSYSGTPVQLTGAAQPFETQEDDDEDFFAPVRTQSGYLRIVDTGKDNDGNAFNWRDLIPATDTDRPVTLTAWNTEVWQGYIQPQTFSGQIYEQVQEREFPLMCPLTVLRGVNVDISIREVKNFAFLLYKIVDATGCQWNYLNFSGDGQQVQQWLRYKIDWMNFIDQDDDGNFVAKYDYYTLLEEVCKFFGWTCRTDGTQIWFLSPDEQFSEDYSRFNMQDLYQLGQDTLVQPQTGRYAFIDIEGDVYASTDNSIQLIRGVHNVKVTADINRQEVVISIPYDKIEDIYKLNTVNDFRYGADGHWFSLHAFDGTGAYYTFDDMIITLLGGNFNHGACFLVQEYYEGSLAYKHNYSWSTCLMVRGDLSTTSYSSDQLVMIQSRALHNYDHGVFCISAGTSQVFVADGTRKQYTGNGKLICRLAIGNKWWNGSSWQNSKTTFDMPIGNEGQAEGQGAGKIIDNRELNGIYNAYEGYGIPIGTAMGGVVDFNIVGVVLDDAHSRTPEIEVTNLKMQFVREKAYANYSDRSENIYEKENTSQFTDDYDVDLIFASANGNAFGLGIIMNRNGSYCEGIDYVYSGGRSVEHPEQHLADRIARYGSRPRYVSDVDLCTNLADPKPYYMIDTPEFSGYPVAIGHNWRDDVTKVKIVDI